jgi:uncharacterized spore protein YtfJ
MPNVDELYERARSAISVRNVFGEAVERDGVTVIPAARVMGGGGGGGDTEGNGGGGFGVYAWPVGAYVIRDGQVTWKPAVDPVRVGLLLLLGVFLLRRSASAR